MTRARRWLTRAQVVALHEQQLARRGGDRSTPDEVRLAGVLARPLRSAIGESHDLFRAAAAYAFGLARERPFGTHDRAVALLAAGVFLAVNGLRLAADETDAATTTLALAVGELDLGGYALWLEGACIPLPRSDGAG